MTEFYITLAVFLAFTLNHSGRILRVLGTLTAALALMMIAWSIVLANLDGTFAAIPPDAERAEHIKPFVLNAQAAIATFASLFLLWASWVQATRRSVEPLPMRNNDKVFGRVSRYAHWVIGIFILILLPMGLFTSVLAADHPERAVFVATHQTLGLTVLLLVVLRVLWLRQNPAPAMRADLIPWKRQAARVTHITLYGLMLGFPVSGIALSVWSGASLEIFGWSLNGLAAPNAQLAAFAGVSHNLVMPTVFYGAIAAHLGAVTKHHFADRNPLDVRRMLR